MVSRLTLRTLQRALGRLPSVEMSEANGVRSLHLGGDAIQSSIRLANPEMLELHYTRAMMAVLLFHPAPRDVLMIGLGGGSIARFLHHHLPATRVTAVEINSRVVAIARAHFGVPADDARLRVVVEDGAHYLPRHRGVADVLLHDVFEDGESVAAVCTQRFFDACVDALKDDGVLVVNFIAEEPRYDVYLGRLERAFNGRILVLPSADRVNMIVFGFKTDARRLAIEPLRRVASSLERRVGLPLASSLRDLLKYNARTAAHLELAALR